MTPQTFSTLPSSKPVVANMSIKLDIADRDRVHSLAAYKNRTPHFIMKEAVKHYLELEEAEQRFIEAAKQSRQHYQNTGLHITHDEFSRWVDELQTNPQAAPPKSHI